MNFLTQLLPILVYILLIIMLVVGIILGIKIIRTLTKVEKVVDDVNNKVQSLNGVFHILDYATDKIVSLSDKIVDGITFIIKKLFSKKKKKTEEKIEEENK